MKNQFEPREIIEYHRKSRQDDPAKTVTEVLAQHKRIADEWVCRNLPDQVPDDNIYMERVSGETIRDRIEFQKVLKRIESPEIKAVFVIEVQRLSRGDLEDAGHIINIFRYTNTLIITPHRTYNLSDSGDRMIVEMELKQGNQYLEYTKAILKRGKDDAARRGIWVLSSAPYGYDIATIEKKRTLVINPDQAEVVRKIYELYNSGYGFHRITSYLNERKIKPLKSDIFSRSTLGAILSNPVYIGKIRWNSTTMQNVIVDGKIKKVRKSNADYELYEGLHEPIIDMDTWKNAQAIRGTHLHTKPGLPLINPLAGILYCGKCGKAMKVEGRKDKHTRFTCPHRAFCGNGSVITDMVYADVAAIIKSEIDNRILLIEKGNQNIVEDWKKEIDIVKSKINKLDEAELKQWADRYESDHPMPDAIFQKLNQKLIADREDLRRLLAKLEAEKPDDTNHLANIIELQKALSDFQNADRTPEEQNKILKNCIESITITRELTKNVHGSYEKNPYSIDIDFKI